MCGNSDNTKEKSFFYRGENALYGSSKPSLFRNRSQNITLDEKLIDLIRRDECWNFLDKFDVVKHWSIGSPNYLALAQHYGFRTEMIDITNDLKTVIMLKAMICIKIINSKNINIALHQNFDGQIYDAFSLIVSLERMKQP